ncbi:MAG: hypothetical protein ACREX3_05800 [Gammaproteobacteria bacterium]
MPYTPQELPEESRFVSATTQYIDIFVRLLGVVLVIAGLWIGLKVVIEAWNLYRMPHRIEVLATAVESGSHLDRALGSYTAASDEAPAKESRAPDALRLSYFLAWGIAMLLLLLAGSLTMAMIRAGAELALRDARNKHLARVIAKELRRTQEVP